MRMDTAIDKAERQLSRGNIPLCVSALWTAIIEAESRGDSETLARGAAVADRLSCEAPDNEGIRSVCDAAQAAFARANPDAV